MVFALAATDDAYLEHIPHHGTGETITARTIVFYEVSSCQPMTEKRSRLPHSWIWLNRISWTALSDSLVYKMLTIEIWTWS